MTATHKFSDALTVIICFGLLLLAALLVTLFMTYHPAVQPAAVVIKAPTPTAARSGTPTASASAVPTINLNNITFPTAVPSNLYKK